MILRHYPFAFLLIAHYSGISEAQEPMPNAPQPSASFMVRPLESRYPFILAEKLLPVEGSYQAEKRQAPAIEGLKVQFDLTNQSDKNIQLFWFLDLLRIRVKNDKGQYFDVPDLEGRTRLRGNLATWTPDMRKLETALQILSLSVNGRELNQKEIYEDTTTDFPPHGHMKLQVAINRVLLPVDPLDGNKVPPAADAPTTSKPSPPKRELSLPTGIYKLWPDLTLWEARPGQRQNYLSPITEDKNQIIVNYTRPEGKK